MKLSHGGGAKAPPSGLPPLRKPGQKTPPPDFRIRGGRAKARDPGRMERAGRRSDRGVKRGVNPLPGIFGSRDLGQMESLGGRSNP
jgi:hypothetical protein